MSAANVMSFQYGTGQTATILVSKNVGRYRVQSDSFEAIWLVLQVTHIVLLLILQKPTQDK